MNLEGLEFPCTCGHCGVAANFEWKLAYIGEDKPQEQDVHSAVSNCPACGGLIVILFWAIYHYADLDNPFHEVLSQRTVLPPSSNYPTAPDEVPLEIAADYTEACLVAPYSSKASAALSRRCLQHALISNGFNQKKLHEQIDAAILTLPSELGKNLDYLRHIGNFAAHPEKDSATGQIVDVSPGEADWSLQVLSELFDHYYVKPARHAAARSDFDKKMAGLGKQPIKKR